ncbi:hypothetical protein SteCoe_36373 [Stentor coeruleus]|uniref:Striatin N-terminal domain-containing protein n=1 Tax=Stentor coeruleus TaxID=5963 RepID=A0A1R2AQ71_9CILI|nr:hypothetical protein SteCoe_36373 [Stentor coeruleus]
MSDFTSYSWAGIIDYIKTQKLTSEREKEEWNIERAKYLSLLQEKDLIIKSLQNENKELSTRIAILEYSMRQESQKTTKRHHRINSDQLSLQIKLNNTKLGSFDDSSKCSPTHRPSQSYGGFTETKYEQVTVPPIQVCSDAKPISKKVWTPKVCLKSHFDSVRGVFFVDSSILASVGEDCMVKLWDCSSVIGENESVDAYLTLRGHKGSIFTLDGGSDLLFTGDAYGTICSWTVPKPKDIDEFSTAQNYCMHKWKAHNDAIWCIRHNPSENALISASSEGCVKLWKMPLEYRSNGPYFKAFIFPGLYNTPTVCNWVPANYKYITVGYGTFITVFNVETSGFSKIPFATETHLSTHQVNCIYTSPQTNLTVTGHEDKRIRFFDLSSNNCIKDMVGHTDSVTDLAIDNTGFYMVSTGHDGSLRSWDLRTFHCLHEITLNRKKYDESIFSVSFHPSQDFLAIGGSDSLIKILDAKDN